METSTWKCSARRAHDCGAEHNQTVGICPGDFSSWVCSTAAKQLPVLPPSTAVRVTVPWLRCAHVRRLSVLHVTSPARLIPGAGEPRFT